MPPSKTSSFVPRRDGNKKRATRNPSTLLARHAIDAIFDKRGHDVAVMDMRDVSGVADFFVVATGDSDLQIRAIVEAVQQSIREQCEERPWHTEGQEHYQWVLLDYVDLVVHVFNRDKREYYDLERLWGDAPVEHVPDDTSAEEVEMLADEQPPRARAEGE